MKLRLTFTTLALSLLIPGTIAQGQFYQGGDRKWGPNGNGTLDHEDDLRWVILHDVQITADNAKGIYVAKWGKDMVGMEGRPFTIIGYMLPIEPTTHSAHFVITRRSSGCPFCPPNEPTEAIEVFTTKAIDYTQSPIALKGTLHLVRSSELGLFYRMDNATVS
jgi:hypothetical protein